MRMLLALWGFVTGAIAETLEWLSRPGSKLKCVAGLLAFAFAVAGLMAFEREQRFQEAVRQLTACNKANAALTARVDDDAAKFAEIAALMRAEAEKIEAMRGKNAAEIDRLAELIDSVHKGAAAWESNYTRRPNECSAALEQLDKACPSLRGY